MSSPPLGLSRFESSGTSNPPYWHQIFDDAVDAAITVLITKLPTGFTTTNLALEVNYTTANANSEVITFKLDVACIDPSNSETVNAKSADVGAQVDATKGAQAYEVNVDSINMTSVNDNAVAGEDMTLILWMLGATGTNHTLTTNLFFRGATLVWDDA